MSNLLRRFTSHSNSETVPSGADHRYEAWSANDESTKAANRSLSQTISFSDFSMHVMDEEESYKVNDRTGLPAPPPRVATKPVAIPGNERSSSNVPSMASLDEELNNLKIHTKVPTSPVSRSLGIPSVASIFGTPKVGVGGLSGETPRSSLDLYDGAISSTPTPTRTSADGGEESVPVSPRSPKTPGGRRRKQKINGLDSFEWLELVRGSSL